MLKEELALRLDGVSNKRFGRNDRSTFFFFLLFLDVLTFVLLTVKKNQLCQRACSHQAREQGLKRLYLVIINLEI